MRERTLLAEAVYAAMIRERDTEFLASCGIVPLNDNDLTTTTHTQETTEC